jgi:ATP-dependent DNA helicase
MPLTHRFYQDWAEDFMGWPLCRIDGETKPFERMEQMARFQDAPDGPSLFLLSTRAGGLGINLTAADTVIFYDQDWVSYAVYHLAGIVA